jgi:hypothetical protein
MGFAPIEGKPDEFLAGQKFFRLFDWEQARLVWVKANPDRSFSVQPVWKSAYLHRFGVIARHGIRYLIGCTLAAHKEAADDWSHPGAVYVGELPDDPAQPFDLQILRDDFYKNHGFELIVLGGVECALIACDSGAYLLTPPEQRGGRWGCEQILPQPVSDIAAIDLDGDGEIEYACIEPFHGRYYRVYKKIGSAYRCIFEHPETSDFYHVATSGFIAGKPVFIGGCRRGAQQLFLLQWNHTRQAVETILVDEGVGPSNAIIVQVDGQDMILSANREAGQGVVYCVMP